MNGSMASNQETRAQKAFASQFGANQNHRFFPVPFNSIDNKSEEAKTDQMHVINAWKVKSVGVPKNVFINGAAMSKHE